MGLVLIGVNRRKQRQNRARGGRGWATHHEFQASLDKRVTFRTDDGATIFAQINGRADVSPGLELPATGYVGLRFETAAALDVTRQRHGTLDHRQGNNTVRVQGECLTIGNKANGTGLVLANCNGSRGQCSYVDDIVRAAGELIFWSGKCVTDPHASTVGDTQMRLYACNRSAGQTGASKLRQTRSSPAPLGTLGPERRSIDHGCRCLSTQVAHIH